MRNALANIGATIARVLEQIRNSAKTVYSVVVKNGRRVLEATVETVAEVVKLPVAAAGAVMQALVTPPRPKPGDGAEAARRADAEAEAEKEAAPPARQSWQPGAALADQDARLLRDAGRALLRGESVEGLPPDLDALLSKFGREDVRRLAEARNREQVRLLLEEVVERDRPRLPPGRRWFDFEAPRNPDGDITLTKGQAVLARQAAGDMLAGGKPAGVPKYVAGLLRRMDRDELAAVAGARGFDATLALLRDADAKPVPLTPPPRPSEEAIAETRERFMRDVLRDMSANRGTAKQAPAPGSVAAPADAPALELAGHDAEYAPATPRPPGM